MTTDEKLKKYEAIVQAGYKVEAYEDNYDAVAFVVYPDGAKLEKRELAKDHWKDVDTQLAEMGDRMIERAFAHYQEKQELAALREFETSAKTILVKIIEWDERFKHYPLSFIEEARRITGKE